MAFIFISFLYFTVCDTSVESLGLANYEWKIFAVTALRDFKFSFAALEPNTTCDLVMRLEGFHVNIERRNKWGMTWVAPPQESRQRWTCMTCVAARRQVRSSVPQTSVSSTDSMHTMFICFGSLEWRLADIANVCNRGATFVWTRAWKNMQVIGSRKSMKDIGFSLEYDIFPCVRRWYHPVSCTPRWCYIVCTTFINLCSFRSHTMSICLLPWWQPKNWVCSRVSTFTPTTSEIRRSLWQTLRNAMYSLASFQCCCLQVIYIVRISSSSCVSFTPSISLFCFHHFGMHRLDARHSMFVVYFAWSCVFAVLTGVSAYLWFRRNSFVFMNLIVIMFFFISIRVFELL